MTNGRSALMHTPKRESPASRGFQLQPNAMLSPVSALPDRILRPEHSATSSETGDLFGSLLSPSLLNPRA